MYIVKHTVQPIENPRDKKTFRAIKYHIAEMIFVFKIQDQRPF